jgi:hypothetical protein
MGRLLAALASLLVYLCVGTVLAQLLGLAYAWRQGYVDREKLLEMAAVAHGLEPREPPPEQVKTEQTSEQPSLEDIDERRAIRARDLELREQALLSGVQRLRDEERKLQADNESSTRVRTEFAAHVKSVAEGAIAKGREDTRLIVENLRPKQAKQQLLEMIGAGEEDEAVALLAQMPPAKQAKICAEFKTPEESKQLDEILRLIRKGQPEAAEIEKTEAAFKELQPSAPN